MIDTQSLSDAISLLEKMHAGRFGSIADAVKEKGIDGQLAETQAALLQAETTIAELRQELAVAEKTIADITDRVQILTTMK